MSFSTRVRHKLFGAGHRNRLKSFCKTVVILTVGCITIYAHPANAQNFEYSETFVNSASYCAGSSQYDNWKTFRSSLDTSAHNFLSVTFSGSINTTGVTCSSAAEVRQIAAALRNGTDVTITCNGVDWTVGTGCGSGCGSGSSSLDAVELNANNQARECYCDVGPILRPAIGNHNWGGYGTTSCNAPTQTMTVKFFAATAPDDAGISAIDSPAQFCPGTHNIVAEIRNYGINQIDTVTVNWSINDTLQTPVLFTGTLDTFGGAGQNSVQVMLGSRMFSAGIPTAIKVWTTGPNNRTDTINRNDTLKVVRMPGLSGTYTIGGTTPDYPTFSAAVADLAFAGVCGPVVFDVRDGTYSEQVNIGKIDGASASNFIRFKSASGDSTACILNYPSSRSDSNWTLLIDGASHLSFHGISLGATGSSYGRVVDIRNVSHNISLSNCIISGTSVTSTSTHYALVFSSSYKNDSLTFSNNIFIDGAYGLYCSGNNSIDREAGTRIINNLFSDQYYMGVYLTYQSGSQVLNNVITSATTYPYGYGIYMYYVRDGFMVANNRVAIDNLEYAVYLGYCAGDSVNRGHVTNNFFSAGHPGATNRVYGIYLYSSAFADIFYNNVSIASSYPENYAFRVDYSSNLRILNNNFLNRGGGYSSYMADTNSVSLSDHNNYFGSGTADFYWDGDLNNLKDWMAATGMDSNSFNVDPLYVSAGDLHVRQPVLKHSGIPVAGIIHDIDGDSRDTLAPDIGADEFILPPVDAGLIAVDSPVTPFNPGSNAIWVSLVNGGTDTLLTDSIAWEINGTPQTTYSWTGNLPSGKVDSVMLGTNSFGAGKADTIVAWTFAPNGISDTLNYNDTISKILVASLSGTYTIGGTTPDFPDFTSAVSALHSGGVAGPVIFDVRNGTYTEQIEIGRIPGVSATNTVTFRSESGDSSLVKMEFSTSSSANYVVLLREAQWIRFHQISFKSLSFSYARVVALEDVNGDIQFSNCVMEGTTSTSTSDINAIFWSDYEAVDSNLVLSQCHLKNGSSAIMLYGDYGSENPGIDISHCLIESPVRYGIYLEYLDGPSIRNNVILPGTTTTFYGVYIYYCPSFSILNNDFKQNNSGYAIYAYESYSNLSSPATIANNFIHIGFSYGNAITAEYCEYLDVYFNSILHAVNSTNYSALEFYACDELNILNNIISCTDGSMAVTFEGGTQINRSDYNNFNVTGPSLGEHSSSSYSSLSGWQAGTGLDSNSIEADPLFVSATDLHTTNILLRDVALPISRITTDIDGELRDSLAPDIGADEFPLPALDCALAGFNSPDIPFSPGNQPVKAIVLNAGLDTLDSVSVGWTMNGVAQSPVTWQGQLATGDTVHVLLGNRSFTLGSGVDIIAWTFLPNGIQDPLNANDTFSLNNIFPGLSGTYTIGGTNPDFANFTAAATALEQGGVYGWVVFNVRDSNYNEQITLSEIAGASATHTITFQSQTGDSTAVRLYYSSNNFSESFVVYLNGADYIRFKNMTLEATSGGYSRVFWLNDRAEHNIITNCIILAPTTTSTSYAYSPILLDYGASNSGNEIMNNLIEGGSRGIYFYGGSSFLGMNNLVKGNILRNQNYCGIYAEYQTDLEISDNVIGMPTGNYSSYFGILTEDTKEEIIISGNKLGVGEGRYGIYMYDHETTGAKRGLIANNFIHGSGNPDVEGMLLYYLENVDIVHNSIHITAESTSTNRALSIYYGSENTVQNNILAQSGGGVAFYLASLFSLDYSDYNNIYTTGSVLAYYSGNRATLADWVSTTGLDSHSISVSPGFISETDLHTFNVAFNNAGIPFSGVPIDIDGQSRSNTAPDIGADEFNASPQDAAVPALVFPAIPFLADSHQVFVRLLNNGLNDLDSVTLNWTVNGVAQPSTKWHGSLNSGDTISTGIGYFNFLPGVGYDIKLWSSSPNGGIDSINTNDTLEVKDLYAALSGTYTIGGVSPDFATFGDAVTTLTYGGVAGPVIFNVRDGSYNEQLRFGNIPGASDTRSVIFQSENSDSTLVELTYSASHSDSNYTVLFDNSAYITFREMTLIATGNTYGKVIYTTNNSHHLSFLQNRITGVDLSTTSSNMIAAHIDGTSDSIIIFRNNLIRYGSIGVQFSGNSSLYQRDNQVVNNLFSDQYYMGIYVAYGHSPLIAENKIQPKTFYSSFNGIYLTSCQYDIRILKNYVNGNTSIRYGILIYSSSGTSSKSALVANNFVSCGTSSWPYPLYLYSSSYIDVYHNSFNAQGNSNSGYSYIAAGSNIRLKNNIFANSSGGSAFYITSSSAVTSSDFNNFYTSGSTLGYWSPTTYSNLSSLRSGTGMDGSSLSINPQFVSATDLHVRESILNGAGTFLSSVSEDIDGELRDSIAPDIGADEFTTFPNDAGLTAVDSPAAGFMAGVHNVWVKLKNYGSDSLTQVTINWTLNGSGQTTVNWNDTLLPEDSALVYLGQVSFSVASAVNIVAWTSQPNGQTDGSRFNDTIEWLNVYPALSGIYSIGGTNPDFPTFTDAVDALNNGGVSGAVTFKVRNGTYNEQILIGSVPGASSSNTITFESENLDSSLVTLSFSGNSSKNYVVYLKGARYVTFRNMGIKATGSHYGRVIWMTDRCENVSFSNNHITGNSATYYYYYPMLIHMGYSGRAKNVVIENNYFENGNYGVLAEGYNTSNPETGLKIEDNIFDDQFRYGLYLSFQASPSIQGNQMHTARGYQGHYNIYIYYASGTPVIAANRIDNESGNIGIYLYAFSGNFSNRMRLVNNFISVAGSSYPRALLISNCNYVNIYFNSLNIYGTDSLNSRALEVTSSSSIYAQNNNLVNSAGAYAVYASSNVFSVSDYNNIYSTGSSLAYYNSGNVGDLASWQSATGKDANSLSIDPFYVSATNLHARQTGLNEMATTISGITTDVDGDLRSTSTPDIGADEFNPVSKDVGIASVINPVTGCGHSSAEKVTVRIKNYGFQPQTNFDVTYIKDNGTPITQSIGTDTIQPGESFDFTFNTTVDIGSQTTYNFIFYTSLTNDSIPANDTLKQAVTNYAPFNPSVIADTSVCYGNTVRLYATGGSSYYWSIGSGSSAIYVSPADTTSYSVTITNAQGCKETDTVRVDVLPVPVAPVITVNGNDTICYGDSVQLSTSATGNLLWNTNATTSSIYAKTSGGYWVRTYNQHGCFTTSATQAVKMLPLPSVTNSAAAGLCPGDTAILTVNDGQSYSWSTGQTTRSISVNPPNDSSFTVAVTNAIGCVYHDTVDVDVLFLNQPGPVSQMIPVDSASEITLPVSFSWFPGTDATKYDLYLWPDSAVQPGTPLTTNINGISTVVYSGLSPGVTYEWLIVSKNTCKDSAGPSQIFTLKDLPDLIVQSVSLPSNAFSGQNVNVNWQVRNSGNGSTGSRVWYDAVYLSADSIYDPGTDSYLGSVKNFSALGKNSSYSQSFGFTLPQGISGNYYVFAVADNYSYLSEANENNNRTRSTSAMSVALTPPPDLVVDSIIVPNNVFSGQTMPITFEVQNNGIGATAGSQWYDRVYFSKDSLFNPANSDLVGTFKHTGVLLPDSSYTRTVNFQIPISDFGRHYIFITTDIHNNIYEHSSELNNTTQSDSITVILTPPPDLAVRSVSVPDSAHNLQWISVDYVVGNEGGSSPVTSWYDRVYISDTADFVPGRSILLKTNLRYGPLQPTDSYSVSSIVRIPHYLTGPYYFFVHTDFNDRIYEFLIETNNIGRSPDAMEVTNADLQVATINTPSADSSGKDILISWYNRNNGHGNLTGRSYYDAVYLSRYSSFDPDSLTYLGELFSNSNINSGDSLLRQKLVTLPNGISGTYYVFIYTDYKNAVVEASGEGNNITRSNGMSVVLSPWPDLLPVSLTLPDTTTAGNLIYIDSEIENKGSSSTASLWSDELYISADSVWNASNATRVSSNSGPAFLQPDSGYSVITPVVLSSTLAQGLYYFYLKTDSKNEIYEHTDENNNLLRSKAVFIYRYPPVDLTVTSVSGPDSANSGQLVNVQWQATNTGLARTIPNQWYDAIYLSTDTILQTSVDKYAGELVHHGFLDTGASYSTARNITIPNGLSGDYYLMLLADRHDVCDDDNRADNVGLMRDSSGNPAVINITFTPPPDLQITSADIPTVGTAGQPIKLKWTVENNGTGPTLAGTWTDRIYLSTDFSITGDPVIATRIHSGNLAVNGSYTDSVEAFLPAGVSGARVIIIVTDNGNAVYEYLNENNNEFNGPVLISQQPPSDLVISEISLPDSAIAGETINITWKVKNTGLNPASGYMTDAVYLSTDSLWDIQDELFGIRSGTINITPNAEASRSLSSKLKNIPLDNYYVLVKTDIKENIRESNDTNNLTASTDLLSVDVKQLYLNVLTPEILENNTELYYRVEVADTLEGESLLVTLKGDSVNGNNELYYRHDQMPTRVDYDESFSDPFAGNQEVVVPELQEGNGYILTYGNKPGSASQNITLHARILDFEVRSVEADKGANAGTITLLVEGSKFDPLMSLYLRKDSIKIKAAAVHYFDPTTVYATFNLKGSPTGDYDVIAQKITGDTAVLYESFEVITGTLGDLQTHLNYPSSTRANRVVALQIDFSNNGNTDLHNVQIELKSVAGAPVAFSVSGLAEEKTSLILNLQESDRLGGVLRPGYHGSIVVYAKSTKALGFILVLPNQ
ncbi:MAG: CARDB domain-containing protein [Bacteroidia bacterium]